MSQEINLLPPRAPRKTFRPAASQGIAVGVGAVAVFAIVLAAYEHYLLQAVQRDAQGIERTVKDARSAHEKTVAERAARKPDAAPDAQLTELEGQLRGRQQVLEALQSGAVGTTSGFSQYMLALSRQSVTGVWLTGFDLAAGASEVTLTGRALSPDLVPKYLQRLTQEAPLQGRQFASMVISQPARPSESAESDKGARSPPPYVEFEISSGTSVRPAAQPAGALPPPPITPDRTLGGTKPEAAK